ncbi:glutathione S-transferase C-terminal domain-containing protein [Sphingomonas sp. J344]|uniref:glutathione S-transferase C-terminal domain-containing protein n=1 Tax=Sphingomonas sp. J344 TaxID=2898434 RepID=UPI0027E27233|nr:glutathione S-transferase C-terminal domain-containing protein [Sphingomonas sp. J344]
MPGKRAAGVAALKLMDEHLASRAWFVGDAPSVADICLYAYTHVAEEGGFVLEPFPAVRAWIARVEGLKGYIPITA